MKKLFLLLALIVTTQLSAVNYCASSSWGYAGTSVTGGGTASPTLVTNESELKKALSGTDPKVVIITEDIEITRRLSVEVSNLTLMALPGKKLYSNKRYQEDSGILIIKGSSSNIILRNLTFKGPGAYDCNGFDNLSLEGVSNIWIDHCDFQDGMDGNFDIKQTKNSPYTTDNITVTWCRFRYFIAPIPHGEGGDSDDHRFSNLVGSDVNIKPIDGWYNITYGYCWWDEGCKQRMTRCRNAELHFLNCYWNSSVADYYVGPENAYCYFEGCTFEGRGKVWQPFTSTGYNSYCKFVNSTGNLPSNAGNVSAPSYSYDKLTAAEAKTVVTDSSCGAGATLTVTKEGAVSSSCDGDAPTRYTITWDATTTGGTCTTTKTEIESGKKIGTLPTATKSGFTFDGWYTEISGGTKISNETVVYCDATYYAHFTEQQEGEGSDLTWNFSTSDFNSLGPISTTTTINGLTLVAKSDATLEVDGSVKDIDGHHFTHRLKTGGSGQSTSRHLYFSVTGACTIEVYLISGKTNPVDIRTLNVYQDSYGGTQLTTMTAGATLSKVSYNYSGGATTIYMGSAKSGINLYAINVKYDTATGVEETQSETQRLNSKKVLQDGQILIIRGNRVYDIYGNLVK
ncbi:MAG: InlB B-repeat-containing protein [Paludibacteraceae bacterium]